MTPERLTNRALEISDDRDLELSFISGLIQLEIQKEYGQWVSRVHVVRATLASPYLNDEVERAWIIATLCEMLAGPKYGLSLGAFEVLWDLWEARRPEWSLDRRMAEYKRVSQTISRGRSA